MENLSTDQDLTIALATERLAEKINAEKAELQEEQDQADHYHRQLSQNSTDGSTAHGRQAIGSQGQKDNLGLMIRGASNFLTSTPPLINFSFSDINFATSNIIGTSSLEKDFRTSTEFVSAEQAQAVQDHIAKVENLNAEGISTLANQEFAALVLAPEILEAKQEQLLTGNRKAFTDATSRVILETHDGVLKMDDGTYAVSPEKLEEIKREGLSGKFDAAGDNAQTPESVPVTTYEYSDNTAAFNIPASGEEAKPPTPSLDITNPEFDLLAPQ